MDALAALLRAFGARSADWPGIGALTPGERIAVCWAHAGEVLRILQPAVDLGELVRVSERFVGESLPAAFADERAYSSDISCPQHMSAETISLWGVAFVSEAREGARCLPEEAALVRKLAAQTVCDAPFPTALLLEPRFLRPNALGSFLATPLADAVDGAGLGDIVGWSSRENQDALLRHGLEMAGGGVDGLNGWHLVLALAGPYHLPGDYEDLLRAAIDRSTGLFTSVDEAFAGGVVRFITRQTRGAPEAGVRSAARAQLSDAIAHRRALGDGDKGVRQLLRASIDLSRDDIGHFQPHIFSDVCAELSRLGGEDGAIVRRFVSQAVWQLPFSDAERLWPLLVSLRAQ